MDLEKVITSVSEKASSVFANGEISVRFDPSQLVEHSWQVSFADGEIYHTGATLNEAFGGASIALQSAGGQNDGQR